MFVNRQVSPPLGRVPGIARRWRVSRSPAPQGRQQDDNRATVYAAYPREFFVRHGSWAAATRDVAASLGIRLGVIAATLQRARAAGLDWPTVEGVDEPTL